MARINWQSGQAGGTKITAARLNAMTALEINDPTSQAHAEVLALVGEGAEITPEVVAANLPARLSETGLSDTIDGAVDGAVVGLAPRAFAHADFRGKPDGPVPVADSGQTIHYVGSGAGRDMAVVNGGLTAIGNRDTGGWAGYATLHADAGFDRSVSTFIMRPGVNTTGVYATGFFATAPYVVGATPSSCHLEIRNRSDWVYKIRDTANGTMTTIATGVFLTPLPLGVELTIAIEVRGDTAYLIFPDGSTATVTNAAIAALPRQVAFFEPYSLSNDDERAAITAFDADVALGVGIPSPARELTRLRAATRAAAGASVHLVTPTANTDTTLTSAYVEPVAGLATFSATAGPGGRIVFTGEFWVTSPATCLIRQRVTGAGGTFTGHVLENQAWKGMVRSSFVATGLTPGVTYSWTWQVSDFTSTTTVIRSSSLVNGRPGTVLATPA